MSYDVVNLNGKPFALIIRTKRYVGIVSFYYDTYVILPN